MIIKICGITRPQDAEAAAEAGASMAGLNFSPRSPRRLDLARARDVAAALKGTGVLKAGVFVDPSEEDVRRAVEEAALDLVQLHGAESPEFAFRLGLPVIKALRVGPAGELDEAQLQRYDAVKHILLDSRDAVSLPRPGGGEGGDSGGGWDYHQAAVAARRYSLILAGGLDESNVGEAVRAVHPDGVDTASGVETAPGIKSAVRIRAFVKAAREAGS